MPSERVQRRIDGLLDEADAALAQRDWQRALEVSEAALGLDSINEDAAAFLESARRGLAAAGPAAADVGSGHQAPDPITEARTDVTSPSESPQPTSFASGRYVVKGSLGERGKKRVYLATDTTLDRDVAFALIKTEGLDDVGRERVRREAQAMGRMGTHPCIMPIYDLGEEPVADGVGTQPYMVQPLMVGGDVEGLVEEVPSELSVGAE